MIEQRMSDPPPGQCRYIVSDSGPETLFCGSPAITSSSWYRWHRQQVYARTTTRDMTAERDYVLPAWSLGNRMRKRVE
jgi:hypothetical protein